MKDAVVRVHALLMPVDYVGAVSVGKVISCVLITIRQLHR